jgi:hypothetical protein
MGPNQLQLRRSFMAWRRCCPRGGVACRVRNGCAALALGQQAAAHAHGLSPGWGASWQQYEAWLMIADLAVPPHVSQLLSAAPCSGAAGPAGSGATLLITFDDRGVRLTHLRRHLIDGGEVLYSAVVDGMGATKRTGQLTAARLWRFACQRGLLHDSYFYTEGSRLGLTNRPALRKWADDACCGMPHQTSEADCHYVGSLMAGGSGCC